MVVVNRTISAPKSVLHCDLDKGHVIRSGNMLLIWSSICSIRRQGLSNVCPQPSRFYPISIPPNLVVIELHYTAAVLSLLVIAPMKFDSKFL